MKQVKAGENNIEVEVHDTPQQLYDFCGKKSHSLNPKGDVANVIVRRKFVRGVSNDLGFLKKENGKYSAIISEYDSGGECGPAWLEKVADAYGIRQSVAAAKKLGFLEVQRHSANGRTRIEMVRG